MVFWATWLKSEFQGYLVQAQLPAFCGFKASESPNKAPRSPYYCARFTCLYNANGLGSLLEQRFFAFLFTHFWSENGPFSRHFAIFKKPKRVTMGS